MTQPLLGQRSRTELIAELYDRHAAGLFAYAHDQLGDAGSASDVLVAVLSNVSDTEPPRAALYALARREIYQRDIVYSPPVTGLDPVATLVQRVLADLRTHQREVLYLSGVCEMDAAELSWVLDVAADTADELTVSACRRLSQSLGLALASARIPAHMAEVFGALAVAPVRDVLNLAPWPTPPARLRSAVLGPRASIAPAIRRPMAPLVRQLWPTTPQWPLPSTENGTGSEAPFGPFSGAPALSTPGRTPEAPEDRFPDPFAPPDRDVLSAHEASTEPMPKLGDSVLTALDAAALRPRRRLQRPRPRRAAPMPAPIPGDVLDDAPGRQDGQEDLFRPPTSEARAARAYTDRLVAAAPRDGERLPGEHVTEPSSPTLGDRTGSGRAGTPGDSGRARPLVPFEPAGASGDVLDDPSAARPLPGWPLQTDQLDALAADERERHARPSSPVAPSVPVGLVTPVPPAPTTPIPPAVPAVPAVLAAPVPPAPRPFPAPAVAPPVVPAPDGPPAPGPSDPVRPHAVDWFADTSSFGGPAGEMPTALPLWTPRPDHLSTPANQARFRLPSWVMPEDHLPEDPPSGVPPRPVPPDRTPTPTPTPYETRHDGWVTAPVDVPAATLPASPAPSAAPAPPPGPALPPEFPWTGRTEAPRPEPAARTTTRTEQPARTAPSGRATSRRRAGRASHARRTRVKTSHHDWAWEVAGFVIAVAIAMIVFFAVPMMTAP
ncbi:hypothetical protein [Streptosporangium longisporum]|uniref:RNA polymerase sigma-70 region 2 domain-containing protein n=1 Tax=Streptosporangium longisporum TaxID=46187 RepID=A0ABP6KHE2_9ACTN